MIITEELKKIMDCKTGIECLESDDPCADCRTEQTKKLISMWLDSVELTKEECNDALQEASPEGFNWDNPSETEIAQHKVIIQTYLATLKKALEEK